MRIGVISDTHGLLREEAVAALEGVDYILHAGDVGDPLILTELGKIAPTTAIRGNIDRQGSCAELPPTESLELGGKLFYIVHSLQDLDIDPIAAQVDVLISGHSHKPSILYHGQVLYLNPGSAGPRRFKLPISLAFVDVGAQVHAEIKELTN